MTATRSDALVVFGATGDLAAKQIFPALQGLVKARRLDMPVVAVGRKDVPIEELRNRIRKSLEKAKAFDAKAFAKLCDELVYAKVDFDEPSSFESIEKALRGAKHPLHYVALPPEVFTKVAENLAAVGLAKGARLALEKPFGHDLASAKKLSADIHPYFDEASLFRIDHFLGKEQVENIIYFRAANPQFERSLNHREVESVAITMAEDFGVEGREAFYESVGAIRDVVQNHLLEVLAHLAMDLPSKRGTDSLREARGALLAQVKPIAKRDVVRGQVEGYRDGEGVAKDSKVETFAALRLFVDSARWEGVPFYIRTGKALASTVTEVVVRWKSTPCPVLDDARPPAPGYVRFRIGPDAAIALGVNVKELGEAMVGETREMVLERDLDDALPPYERLLGDALDGDHMLFARKEEAEASWRVVDPIVGEGPVHSYKKGSSGPQEAEALQPPGGWPELRKVVKHA